jgi:hypothetical protein
MKMLRGLVTAGICLIVIGTTVALAEVSVRLDRQGNYAATQVLTKSARGEPVVWGMHGRAYRRAHALNPRGDLLGDLWPVITEPEIAPHHPWVVWSRFNGDDFDLVWSRWADGGWRPIRPVAVAPTVGDDLDPDMTFNTEGRPYLVWSREENGVSRVYFSTFLVLQWMPGFQISEEGVDSRYPAIVDRFGDAIQVEFDTPQGKARKWVVFNRPVTITDDINPLSYVRVKGHPSHVEE